jgi:hypothetical protein
VFLNSLSQTDEPKNFEIAKLDPKWCKAMDEELHALEKKIKLGKYIFYQKIRNRLVASGYIRLNIVVMIS